MQQKNVKLFIYPLISLGIFIVLVFGAAYAYIAGTITMNTSNYQVTLPQQTSLVCTKTDCGVTITPAMMVNTNTGSSAKTSATCSVNCTCSGTQGASCAYNVYMVEAGTKYVPSSSLGTNKEFTVTVTSPTGCTTQNSSGTETQVNTLNSKIVSNCTLTVPQSGSVSANVTAEFKWYNLDMPQDGHASKTYKYQLSTGNDIPDAYQLVEYLESNGSQAIDTGIVPNGNTIWEIKFRKHTDANPYQGLYETNQRFRIDNNTAGLGTNYAYFDGNTTAIPKDKDYIVIWNTATPSITIDSTVTNVSTPNFTTSLTIHLFAQKNASSITYGKSRVYYSKITQNGVLVRDLVPCVRKLDNVAGMYDKVTGTFFKNINTGSFTAGNNI